LRSDHNSNRRPKLRPLIKSQKLCNEYFQCGTHSIKMQCESECNVLGLNFFSFIVRDYWTGIKMKSWTLISMYFIVLLSLLLHPPTTDREELLNDGCQVSLVSSVPKYFMSSRAFQHPICFWNSHRMPHYWAWSFTQNVVNAKLIPFCGIELVILRGMGKHC